MSNTREGFEGDIERNREEDRIANLDDFDDEDDVEDDFDDAASFPTQEDLESIVVQPSESVIGDVDIRSVSSMDYGINVHPTFGNHTGGVVTEVGIGIGIGIGIGVGISTNSLTGASLENNTLMRRTGYGSSIGGGSIGCLSEKSETVMKRSLSFCSDHEYPQTHSHSQPHTLSLDPMRMSSSRSAYSESKQDCSASNSEKDRDTQNSHMANIQERALLDNTTLHLLATAEIITVKSDVATICSGSIGEDIDLASVGTAHSTANINTSITAAALPISSPLDKSTKKRGVGFAVETWTTAHSHVQDHSAKSSKSLSKLRSSPLQSPIVASLTAKSFTLNDMGPPLNRILLERVMSARAGSVKSFASSTGTPSRPDSVRSFGSVAASEVVHVDTDDCGGSMVGSESEGHLELGACETHSERSHDHNDDMMSSCAVDHMKVVGSLAKETNNSISHFLNVHPEIDEESKDEFRKIEPQENEAMRLDRLSVNNGRMSPGGTIYRGRGIRRYQGRFMNLPMKRFHQSASGMTSSIPLSLMDGSTIEAQGNHAQLEDNQREAWSGDRKSWDRTRSRSRSRSRSPSRERAQNGMKRHRYCDHDTKNDSASTDREPHQSHDNWDRDNHDSNFQQRKSGDDTYRRKNDNRGNHSNRHRNNSRRGGRGRFRQRGRYNNSGRSMTPRGPKHGDCL